MLPISDTENPGIFPIATYFLLGLNVLVFILMFTMSEAGLENFIYTYALIPQEIVNGQDIYTLLTSMFLHGGIGHIFGNMLFLHVFGNNLEAAFGRIKYVLFYLVCGLAASALQVFVDPTSTIPNLGASGAIAGLLGGYLVLFPNHRVDVLVSGSGMRSTLPAYTMLIYWIVFQFLQGIGSLGAPGTGGVAYFAHIGGFIGGVVLAKFTNSIVKTRLNYS